MLIDSSKSTPQKIFDLIHRNIVAIIIAVVVLAGAISTVAIITGSDGNKEQERENVSYEEMNTLYFAMDKVESLNPLSSDELDTYYISQLIYNSLFKLDANLNIEKDLVDSYNTESDEGKVSIKLKDGVSFSDGSSLSAYDVSYTVSTIKSLGEKSPYYSYVSKISSVYVTDDKSLSIYFKSADDAALDNLVFPIVSRLSYRRDSNDVPGTGQYKYSSYNKRKALKLKPNKEYFNKKATQRIEFKVVENKEATTGLITCDMVSAYLNKSMDADVDAEEKELKYTPIASPEAEIMGFNFKNKYLQDSKVRKAIAYAIDEDTLIKDNYGGTAVKCDTIYYPGFLGVDNTKNVYGEDQRKAATLLSNAGLEDSDADGYLDNKKGKNIEFTIIVEKNNDSRQDAAYTISDALENVGIKAKVKALSKEEFRERLKSKKFDIFLCGYTFDKQYNLKKLFDKGNVSRYNNKAVRSLVEKLETTITKEQLAKTYGELNEILTDEVPYYCLCYKTYGFVTVRHFENESKPTFFNPYRGCSDWKWKKVVVTETTADDDKSEEDK